MKDITLQFVNVSKKFGDFSAVKPFNLDIFKGEIYGFIGPNGAGKTTTMKMAADLLKPTTGDVHITGFNLKTEPIQAKMNLGYIPDRVYLYEKLTGNEFLSFIASLYQVKKQDLVKRSRELLDLFELQDWSNSLIENYSHGMRQRLSFTAALLHAPKVLIIDEPLIGLDPKGARLLLHLLTRLKDTLGITIFFSTHILSIVAEICDRIGIIHRGALVAQGTMAELKQQALQAADNQATFNVEDIFFRLTGEILSEDQPEIDKVIEGIRGDY